MLSTACAFEVSQHAKSEFIIGERAGKRKNAGPIAHLSMLDQASGANGDSHQPTDSQRSENKEISEVAPETPDCPGFPHWKSLRRCGIVPNKALSPPTLASND